MEDLDRVISAAEATLAEAKGFASGEPNAMGGTIDPIDQRAAWQACGIFEVFLNNLRGTAAQAKPH